jgi:hypothetical protein
MGTISQATDFDQDGLRAATTAAEPELRAPVLAYASSRDHLKAKIAQLEARLVDRRRDLRERMLSSALLRLPRTATAEEVTALADKLLAYVEKNDATASPGTYSGQFSPVP